MKKTILARELKVLIVFIMTILVILITLLVINFFKDTKNKKITDEIAIKNSTIESVESYFKKFQSFGIYDFTAFDRALNPLDSNVYTPGNDFRLKTINIYNEILKSNIENENLENIKGIFKLIRVDSLEVVKEVNKNYYEGIIEIETYEGFDSLYNFSETGEDLNKISDEIKYLKSQQSEINYVNIKDIYIILITLIFILFYPLRLMIIGWRWSNSILKRKNEG